MNKSVARSLFSIDNKSIQIEEVHSIISKNKDVFLKHLGSFSVTMHDTKIFEENNANSKFTTQGLKNTNQDEDLLVDITPDTNAQNEFDLFDIDIPDSNPPVVTSNPVNDDDLFGLDIPTTQPNLEIKTSQP